MIQTQHIILSLLLVSVSHCFIIEVFQKTKKCYYTDQSPDKVIALYI